MRRMLAAVGTMLLVCVARVWAQAPGSEAWEKLVAANNLDVGGKQPFHLGITFQLYDLDGKPGDAGSLETWWSGPGRERMVVHLAGLNEDGSAPAGADAALVRDAYLVRQLVEFEIGPVPKVTPVGELKTTPMNVGKTRLDCLGRKRGLAEDVFVQVAVACVAPNTTQVMILKEDDGEIALIRPRMGTFQDTHVALESRIGYLGRDAIAGQVTMLQTDPSAKAEGPAASAGPERLDSLREVSAKASVKQRIKFAVPNYPDRAKVEHLAGTVLLNVIIGVDGHVRRIVPIASTDPMFTQAAAEAVKQWVYTPFLLNGAPTEVDTVITINFALDRG